MVLFFYHVSPRVQIQHQAWWEVYLFYEPSCLEAPIFTCFCFETGSLAQAGLELLCSPKGSAGMDPVPGCQGLRSRFALCDLSPGPCACQAGKLATELQVLPCFILLRQSLKLTVLLFLPEECWYYSCMLLCLAPPTPQLSYFQHTI